MIVVECWNNGVMAQKPVWSLLTSGCHPGPGEFFEIIDEGTLRYTTDYSVAGVLHKTS